MKYVCKFVVVLAYRMDFERPLDANHHFKRLTGICYIGYGTALRKEDMLEAEQGTGTDDVPYVCRFPPCL